MDLDEYHQDLRNKVSLRADLENDYKSSSFMAEVAEELEDAGEIENLTLLHFEGTGSGRRKLVVDGYDLDDPDGSVALAALVFTGSETLSTLTMADTKRTLTQLENFLREARSGDFVREREESSPAYMLAESLRQRGRSITRYRLYLITDAKLSDRSKTIETSGLDGVPIEYHIWDMSRLYQVHESKQGREALDIDLTCWLQGGLPALEISQTEDFSTYLAAVPGAIIADLYERYGSRLLESNVRSYLSARGKVNKGIRTTVQKEPGMFLAYNNGITATATGVKTKGGIGGQCSLQMIRDLQIVNGGQTTASLFFIRREERAADLAPVYVQMKLVVVDPERAVEIVPNISRYANSQNRVSEVDFFSNSPYHVRLEELSRRVLVPAQPGVNFQTKWFYERTRGQYANERAKLSVSQQKKFDATYPRRQVITKTDLAKYEVSFDQKPHMVSAGAQKNFVAFADAVGTRWEKAPTDFNELYFKEVVAKAVVYNEFRNLISRAEWYDKGYLANIVTYTIAKIIYEVDRQAGGRQIDLMSIWNSQSISSAMSDTALKIGEVVFGFLTAPNRGVQNVTEWAKRKECWDSVAQAQIPLSEEFLAELVRREQRVVARKDARAVQKIDDGIEAQMKVLKIATPIWTTAADFGTQRRVLSPKDLGILNVVIKGDIPSERQSLYLLDVMRRLEDSGFKFDGSAG
ncbi:AIPR family protein [Mycobacterium sp. HUMS_1102779]|uniref:AIPR family protein n=1 Tax=Mycobacterium sp. HUMS_1102779 TaxID=3383487 RepID=UPI00389B0995